MRKPCYAATSSYSCRASWMTHRGRIRRSPGDVHAAATQLDEEQDVESLQPNCLDREEVNGQLSTDQCCAVGRGAAARFAGDAKYTASAKFISRLPVTLTNASANARST